MHHCLAVFGAAVLIKDQHEEASPAIAVRPTHYVATHSRLKVRCQGTSHEQHSNFHAETTPFLTNSTQKRSNVEVF